MIDGGVPTDLDPAACGTPAGTEIPIFTAGDRIGRIEATESEEGIPGYSQVGGGDEADGAIGSVVHFVKEIEQFLGGLGEGVGGQCIDHPTRDEEGMVVLTGCQETIQPTRSGEAIVVEKNQPPAPGHRCPGIACVRRSLSGLAEQDDSVGFGADVDGGSRRVIIDHQHFHGWPGGIRSEAAKALAKGFGTIAGGDDDRHLRRCAGRTARLAAGECGVGRAHDEVFNSS